MVGLGGVTFACQHWANSSETDSQQLNPHVQAATKASAETLFKAEFWSLKLIAQEDSGLTRDSLKCGFLSKKKQKSFFWQHVLLTALWISRLFFFFNFEPSSSYFLMKFKKHREKTGWFYFSQHSKLPWDTCYLYLNMTLWNVCGKYLTSCRGIQSFH